MIATSSRSAWTQQLLEVFHLIGMIRPQMSWIRISSQGGTLTLIFLPLRITSMSRSSRGIPILKTLLTAFHTSLHKSKSNLGTIDNCVERPVQAVRLWTWNDARVEPSVPSILQLTTKQAFCISAAIVQFGCWLCDMLLRKSPLASKLNYCGRNTACVTVIGKVQTNLITDPQHLIVLLNTGSTTLLNKVNY